MLLTQPIGRGTRESLKESKRKTVKTVDRPLGAYLH